MSVSPESLIEELTENRERLLAELRERPSGLEWCERHTVIADDVVRTLYTRLIAELKEVPAFAIVATGGYGRRELAPWSDIDLTFIPLNEADPNLEQAIKWLYKSVHDAFSEHMKLKVGYALRFASDAPSLDAATRSGLLDSRVVTGSREAYDQFMKVFWESFPVAEFVIDKIKEHEVSTGRTNDSPYSVQPDLKTGAGGLRSFQTANWIGAAIGERMVRPSREYDTVTKYRNILHLISGKASERLTFGKRQEVADLVGRDPLDLGSEIASALESLESEFRSSVDRLQEARFMLAPHVSAIRGEARIGADATAGDAAIGISNATQLELRVSDVPSHPVGKVSASQALSALTAGEKTLRYLDRAGVLEALLPELTACRTLMPRDSSHDFTVFEHTLRVVRNLDNAHRNSFFGSIKSALRDVGPLYLSALLHDVGRIETEVGHEKAGAEIAAKVCDRWGAYETTKETVVWLVAEHLTLDRTLRMRDVMQPETAFEFAQIVETPERLALLTLLTWADVNAVSEHAWTPAQETFLRELYERTLNVLSSDQPPVADSAVYLRRLVERAKNTDIPQDAYERFLESMPAHYLLATEPDLAHAHFGLVQSAKLGEVSVVLHDIPEMGATDITVCCQDEPGLLSRILGSLYANELSIIAIRASTAKDDGQVALDTVTVTFGGRPVPRATAVLVAEQIKSVLSGESDVVEILLAAKKVPDRAQQVFTYKFIEGDPGIIEIQAPRGRGMAYRLSRQLAEHEIDIVGARVGQWAGAGTAAFYVTGQGGSRLMPAKVAEALERQKV